MSTFILTIDCDSCGQDFQTYPMSRDDLTMILNEEFCIAVQGSDQDLIMKGLCQKCMMIKDHYDNLT